MRLILPVPDAPWLCVLGWLLHGVLFFAFVMVAM
jgi:hypothetical protein